MVCGPDEVRGTRDSEKKIIIFLLFSPPPLTPFFTHKYFVLVQKKIAGVPLENQEFQDLLTRMHQVYQSSHSKDFEHDDVPKKKKKSGLKKKKVEEEEEEEQEEGEVNHVEAKKVEKPKTKLSIKPNNEGGTCPHCGKKHYDHPGCNQNEKGPNYGKSIREIIDERKSKRDGYSGENSRTDSSHETGGDSFVHF